LNNVTLSLLILYWNLYMNASYGGMG